MTRRSSRSSKSKDTPFICAYRKKTWANPRRAIQTSPNPVVNSPHACDRLPSRSLRTLLQEPPAFHPNPRLRDAARHRPRPHPDAGPVLVHARRRDHDPASLPLRIRLRLRADRHRCAEPPPRVADGRGDCALLLPRPAAQVLAAAPAAALAVFAAAQRPHHHSLQLWAYARRHDMAYPAWTRVDCIRCRLEPGQGECLCRRGVARRCWRRRCRGYRAAAQAYGPDLQ